MTASVQLILDQPSTLITLSCKLACGVCEQFPSVYMVIWQCYCGVCRVCEQFSSVYMVIWQWYGGACRVCEQFSSVYTVIWQWYDGACRVCEQFSSVYTVIWQWYGGACRVCEQFSSVYMVIWQWYGGAAQLELWHCVPMPVWSETATRFALMESFRAPTWPLEIRLVSNNISYTPVHHKYSWSVGMETFWPFVPALFYRLTGGKVSQLYNLNSINEEGSLIFPHV